MRSTAELCNEIKCTSDELKKSEDLVVKITSRPCNGKITDLIIPEVEKLDVPESLKIYTAFKLGQCF